MRGRIHFVLPLLLALAACDGGSRGSGITTAQGNVESVQTALLAPTRRPPLDRWARLWSWIRPEGRAEAEAGVAGIRVLVEGTMIEDETDGAGSFKLRGNFEGDVVIRFERPGSGSSARASVNAPAGGTLTLENIHVDELSGEATADNYGVAFEGLVLSSDCTTSRLELVSRHRNPADTDVYDVRLADSSIHDVNGAPLGCQDLRGGDAVRLAGSVNDDGTFGRADIVRE